MATLRELITSLVERELRLDESEFELFGLQHEGKPLPGGFEEESGHILTMDEKVYDFWLKWDPAKTAPNGSLGYYTVGDTVVRSDGIPFFREVNSEDMRALERSRAYLQAKDILMRRRKEN